MKKYIYSSVLLILLIIQCGCEKQLQLDPQDTLTDAAFWKTPNDYELYSNNFYSFLPRWGAGSYLETEDLWADLQAGSAINTISNSTYPIPATDNNWNTGYSRLRSVNYLIEKAKTYPRPDEIKNSVAEAKFFRAYSYWLLYRRFGGVPIINKVLDVDSPELFSPRATRDETCDQILSDLDAAIPDLPLESAIPSNRKGRISKGAAQALAAKVALYDGTWNKFRGNTARANTMLDKAIAYSGSVMTDASYKLFFNATLGIQSYRYMFILENQKSNPAGAGKADNKEYILTNKYDFDVKIPNLQITHREVGYFTSPTRKMADMYLCIDGLPISKSPLYKGKAGPTSEYMNRDPRMSLNMRLPGKKYWENNLNGRVNWTGDVADSATALRYIASWGNTRTGYNSQKWCTERNNGNGANANGDSYDIPVIRLAEILLTNVEAKFERNGSVSDADLDLTINKLRDRVGMIHLTNAQVTSNGLDMRTEIRRERTVEFYNEALRYDDLIRWKTAETELPQAMTGALITGTWRTSNYTFAPGSVYTPLSSWAGKLDPDGYYIYETATNRKFTEKYYQFPIPTNEIILNPKLEQNPGWL